MDNVKCLFLFSQIYWITLVTWQFVSLQDSINNITKEKRISDLSQNIDKRDITPEFDSYPI